MNILEFANPIGWWWAALAIPLALLYVLKVRLRRQTVSTFLFWDQVFQEKKPRSWWQQLRHLLSLLLQLAFLALLVFALVDPLWQWQKAQRRKVLVVVDNSASMAATENGKTRLERAQETAAALVRSLRVGDEMAILTAGGKPEVAIGLTDHSRSLLETVSAIEQTDAPSALTETVTAAKRLLVGDTRSVIYVLTDGCDAAIEPMQKDESINLVGFGGKQDNVAITQFQVRRSLLDAIGYQILVEVSNFSQTDYKGRLELELENRIVDVVPIELKPDEHKTLHLDQASTSGGRLVARLDADDALATDNQALAVLPTRRPISVALATPGSLFLKSVLESIPLVDLKIFEQAPDLNIANNASANAPDQPADANNSPVAAMPIELPPEARRPIIILHRAMPKQLPPGKLLVINPSLDCELWSLGEPIAQPLVASISPDSPVTQHVKLTNVLFPKARSINFTQEAELLIKTPLDEPLLARIRRPTGDVLVLNVDLDEGDLPLRIAFPVLMKNALEWFDGSQGELQPAIATGSTTKVLLPQLAKATNDSGELSASDTSTLDSGAADSAKQLAKLESDPSIAKTKAPESTEAAAVDYWVRDPKGKLTPLAHDAESATLAVMKHSGLWAVGTEANLTNDPWLAGDEQSSSKDSTNSKLDSATSTSEDNAESDNAKKIKIQSAVRHLACNLSSRAESDVRPKLELTSANELGLVSLGGRSIWFYCVCAALALTAIEWWLYQRRIVG